MMKNSDWMLLLEELSKQLNKNQKSFLSIPNWRLIEMFREQFFKKETKQDNENL